MIIVRASSAIGSATLRPKLWNFPAGEFGCKLSAEDIAALRTFHKVDIRWAYEGDHELMQIAMIKEAIAHVFLNYGAPVGEIEFHLEMPYIPYARQDRRCVEGEAHSLVVFCKTLNAIGFNSVSVVDPHSYVSQGLINNVLVKRQEDIMHEEIIREYHYRSCYKGWRLVIIAPDQGAMKKASAIAKKVSGAYPHVELVCCSKERNLATGDIISTHVPLPEMGNWRDVLIVIDDICDGGRTFVELAKAIPAERRVHLHLLVTHGIFSNDLHELHSYYERIFCHNLMNKKVAEFRASALGGPFTSFNTI